MKPTPHTPRQDPIVPKPSFRKLDVPDKRSPLPKKGAERWRIVQSMHAGRVRGAHRFH